MRPATWERNAADTSGKLVCGIMRLFASRQSPYLVAMKKPASTLLKLVLGVGALAALSGVAFAAWVDHGDDMLVSMFEAGLAWCM